MPCDKNSHTAFFFIKANTINNLTDKRIDKISFKNIFLFSKMRSMLLG